MKKLFLLLVLFCSACMTQNVTTGTNIGKLSFKERQHFFVDGIAQKKTVNATQICRGRSVGMVKSTFEPLDIVFGIVTFGIYTPRTLEIYCR